MVAFVHVGSPAGSTESEGLTCTWPWCKGHLASIKAVGYPVRLLP